MAKRGIELFGKEWNPKANLLDIYLYCFLHGQKACPNPAPRHDIFWKIQEIIAPNFKRNPWSDRTIENACKTQLLSLAGSSASSKSATIALWVVINWMCAPDRTACLILSTTLEGAKKRIWKCIKEILIPLTNPHSFHLPGKLVDNPTPTLVYVDEYGKTHDTSGIFVFPSERGEAAKSCSKIQGIHNERVIVVIDEATGAAQSIVDTIYDNLRSNPYYWICDIGNPVSRYDPHGQMCTPAVGWGGISVNDEIWAVQWRDEKGICVHYDALKNPNYLAKENIYPFLQNFEIIDKYLAGDGINSAGFWTMYRGFWSPIGVEKTVFTEADLLKFKGVQTPIWRRPPIRFAGLDPAFTLGSDRAMMALILVGENSEGTTVICIEKTEQIQDDVTNIEDPLNFQRARKFKEFCKANDVVAKFAGFDSTGGGIPFGDILCVEFSKEVLPISFGGAASDRVIGSGTEAKKANEHYANRATELIFNAASFLRNGQLSGITPDIATEWTSRRYDYKNDTLVRIQVEPKKDFKGRVGYSPDTSDAILVAIAVAVQRLNLIPGSSGNIETDNKTPNWKKSFEKFKRGKVESLRSSSNSHGWNKPLNRNGTAE